MSNKTTSAFMGFGENRSNATVINDTVKQSSIKHDPQRRIDNVADVMSII